MRVLISGVTGFVGKHLATSFRADGHEVVGLSRSAGPGLAVWDIATGDIDTEATGDVDVVVHLAGEPVGKRWTAARRVAIADSRVQGTKLLASYVAETKPRVFVSGSAIGYYGDRGDEILSEESSGGSGFLAEVCQAWEASASAAEISGVPTALIRTGIVLNRKDGILPRFLLLSRTGLGGRTGSGQQFLSWISTQDEIRAIRHIVDHELSGPFNLTAPHPVTNREFTRLLAARLKRPALVPAPAFAMRAMMGSDFTNEMVLGGQRVLPEALSASGFTFAHPTLESAFAAIS
jgi:uncharacterized protein (TIGR01777 family)